MSIDSVVAVISGLIIVSYLFGVLSKRWRIPSVLLLLATGVAVKIVFPDLPLSGEASRWLVHFFGLAGLVMIVLEASLDLELSLEKIRVLRAAFLSSSVILFVSSVLIAGLFHLWLGAPWRNCLIYAVPLSIISSAIVIPTSEHLTGEKREFVVFESSFSDILGIIFFNVLTFSPTFEAGSLAGFGISVVVLLVGSYVLSLALLWVASRLTANTKMFLLLAVLFLVYSVGKIFHLPTLILILMFGLVLNNVQRLPVKHVGTYLDVNAVVPIVDQFKSITRESAFVIRTFFFLLFGFAIEWATMMNLAVYLVGLMIVVILLGIRYVYFAYFLKTNTFPEVFLMPRGLITILLFYSIPTAYIVPSFEQGILFFVVIITTVLMTAGMLAYRPQDVAQLEEDAA
jgi:Kef-type K+ transport system membrane component KefB